MSELLSDRAARNREVYARVYRDYPSYGNRDIRIGLTREWLEPFRTAQTLLDVGCGRGEVLDMAHDLKFAPRGCEIVPELAERRDVDLIRTAAELPYASDSFDLVTCTDVAEHIDETDLPKVLAELARVARGMALVTTCHRPDTPGKFGPDTLHITVKPREWWEMIICKYMGEPVVLYRDRVNGNGTWFDVRCE